MHRLLRAEVRCPQASPPASYAHSPPVFSLTEDWTAYERKVEHVIFRALRNSSPPTRLANDGAVVQIACLEKLYRAFERC